MATTAGDEQTVQFMLKRWQDPQTGLDQAWREEYKVYLSFPDPKNPNKVTVGQSTGCRNQFYRLKRCQRFQLIDRGENMLSFHYESFISVNSSDAVLHTVREKEKSYYAEQEDPEVVQPYAAYSPAGHAKVSNKV